MQYYIVSRYLEDHPDFLKDILIDESTRNIFAYLVRPLSGDDLFKPSNPDAFFALSYWMITLDKSESPDKQSFCDPANILQYLMSKAFFAECPYLASAEYHNTCKPLFEISSAIAITPREVFEQFKKSIWSGPIFSHAQERNRDFMKREDFAIMANAPVAGILYLSSWPSQSFFQHKKEDKTSRAGDLPGRTNGPTAGSF